jgi:putative transposase
LRGQAKDQPQSGLRRQNIGIKEVADRIWLVTFMHYDLGFFDHEACRLEPVENPFEPKVSPMSPV